MYCPVCREVQLVMSDRQGIEIDYCPQCRGVWLDRGELDKLIDRSATATARPSDVGGYQQGTPERPHYDDRDHGYDYRRKKKREGFLGELFDFD